MTTAEQWENLRSDASTVSKINSYRKIAPVCIKARGGGRGRGICRGLCYSGFSAGEVGADHNMAKCFSCTCPGLTAMTALYALTEMTEANISPSHTHCFSFSLEPLE